METREINHAGSPVRFWWASAAIGGIMLILGVLGFFTKDPSLLSMSLWFTIAFIASGILDLLLGISNRNVLTGTGKLIVLGGLELVTGVMLLFLSPTKLEGMMVYITGGWILLRSIWMLLEYFSMRREGDSSLMILILSCIGLLFSAMFLLMPLFGWISRASYLFIAILSYAAFRILYSIKTKNLFTAE